MSRIRHSTRRRHRMAGSLALLVSAAAVAACGSNQPVKLAASSPKPTPTKTATPTPTPPPTPTPTPKPPIVDGATYASPALVQIENLNAARPESGLQSANVVYEYSAEGGIGRFTAVYFAAPQGQVGPVRSARLVASTRRTLRATTRPRRPAACSASRRATRPTTSTPTAAASTPWSTSSTDPP
jgi:hypothetical protein